MQYVETWFRWQKTCFHIFWALQFYFICKYERFGKGLQRGWLVNPNPNIINNHTSINMRGGEVDVHLNQPPHFASTSKCKAIFKWGPGRNFGCLRKKRRLEIRGNMVPVTKVSFHIFLALHLIKIYKHERFGKGLQGGWLANPYPGLNNSRFVQLHILHIIC